MPSGYTSTTPADLLLDSGLLYIGATVFAATRGGLRFDPGMEWRNVDFDGKRSAIAGLDRVVGFDPVISGTVLDVSTAADLLVLQPGATSAVVLTTTTLTPPDASVMLTAGQYITNLRAVWARGSGGFYEVKFPKSLCRSWSIAGSDKDEAGIEVEFAARLDMSVSGAVTDDPPFVERLIALITD